MSILEAVIQGVVQGLTEFLPVSSSGHLALSQHVLGVKGNNLFFDVMLHLGTLIAVIAFYYKLVLRLISAFFSMLKDLFTGKFKYKNLNHDKKLVIMLIIGLLPLFCLFIPIPKTSLILKDIAEILANSGNILVVGISLIATSLLLLIGVKRVKSTSKYKFKTQKDFSGRTSFAPLDAICVGFMQCAAAIFPGLSRSGSTLSVGLLRGINRQTALDYSFILGIPSVFAAAIFEFKEVYDSGLTEIDVLPVVIGVLVSAVVGFLAIKLFKWMLATNKMGIFIAYTLILGTITIAVYFIEQNVGYNIFTKLPL